MVKYILIILFISQNILLSQFNWEYKKEANLYESFKYIKCRDSICYVLGDYFEELINVLRSTDYGESWEKVYHSFELPYMAYGFALSYPCPGYVYIATHYPIILRTKDNFKTVDTLLLRDSISLTKNEYFRSLSMSDSLTGVVFSPTSLYKTTDGWETVEDLTDLRYSDIIPENRTVFFGNEFSNLVHTFDKDNFLLNMSALKYVNQYEAIRYNYISRTNDGGKTWHLFELANQEALIDTSIYMSDFYFIDKLSGWALGQRINTKVYPRVDNQNLVYKTTDGGYNWEIIWEDEPQTKRFLISISFRDSLFGIASGKEAVLMLTTDGGKSWQDISEKNLSPDARGGRVVQRVAFAGDNPIIAAFGDGILKGYYSTSISDKIESKDNIYPNPASDFITIQLSNKGLQPFATEEKVQIFDVLGIEIMSESIHPLADSHRMNVVKLPVGVYFIRIGNKVEKFIKKEF